MTKRTKFFFIDATIIVSYIISIESNLISKLYLNKRKKKKKLL